MIRLQQGPNRNAFSLIELLVVIAILGVLIAMLFPAIHQVRESARRAQCLNKLRQMGLSALNYESATDNLPPPSVGENDSDELGSTLVVLLPYVEDNSRFRQLDINSNIFEGTNAEFTAKRLDLYLCPSMRNSEFNNEGSYIISFSSEYLGSGSESIPSCLLYTSPSPRDATLSRMPSSA